MELSKPINNLRSDSNNANKKSNFDVLTRENDFLVKSLKKPKGSSKTAA
tara:strand:- start:461 stop:607 length:147 start_codon:yes stop_codon:yes gene_type:complete